MRKRVFRVLFISIFAAMLGLGIVAPLMPIYAKSMGANGIWLGIIFSGYSVSRVLFMPIVGRVSDKTGRKIFIASGLLLYSLISLLYPLAGNVYTLTTIRFVHGLASAMVIPIAMAYIGETSEAGKEGTSMGTFNIALFLGMGAGPFLGGLLNDSYGIKSVFYAMSCLTAIAFFITLFFLPAIQPHRKARGKTRPLFHVIIRNKLLRGLLLFRIVNAMGRGSIMAFLPIFASSIHITSSQIGTLISVNLFLTALLQPPCGMLADRCSRPYLVIAGSMVGVIALFLVSLTHTFGELLFVNSLMGVGGAIALPSASALTVDVGHTVGMGVSMGMFSMAMSIGMITSPLILGVVLDAFGLKAIFYAAAAIGFIGTFVVLQLLRKVPCP